MMKVKNCHRLPQGRQGMWSLNLRLWLSAPCWVTFLWRWDSLTQPIRYFIWWIIFLLHLQLNEQLCLSQCLHSGGTSGCHRSVLLSLSSAFSQWEGIAIRRKRRFARFLNLSLYYYLLGSILCTLGGGNSVLILGFQPSSLVVVQFYTKQAPGGVICNHFT